MCVDAAGCTDTGRRVDRQSDLTALLMEKCHCNDTEDIISIGPLLFSPMDGVE